MTRAEEQLTVEQRTVVVFDICSSTRMLEDLVLTGNMKRWRNLLIALKQFMETEARSVQFEIYKFIGDGWILLFDESITGMQLMSFLERLAEFYRATLASEVVYALQSTPSSMGLTFGVDRGTLIRMEMFGQSEYVGRPINLASRLQSALKEGDSTPGYKVLFSKPAYHALRIPNAWKSHDTKRVLRNVLGNEPCECIKALLHSVESSIDCDSAHMVDIRGRDIGRMGETALIDQHKRSSKELVEKRCPVCDSSLIYWQKKKSGAIKALECKKCQHRLFSREINGEFFLHARVPVPEDVKCPICQESFSIELDPVPGVSKTLTCPRCQERIRVSRGNGEVLVRGVREASNRFSVSEDLIEAIAKGMGPQPWPKGQCKQVAEKLGMSEISAQKVVQLLIYRGAFKPQRNGRLYAPDATGTPNTE